MLNEAFPSFDVEFEDVLPTVTLNAVEDKTDEQKDATSSDGEQQELETVMKEINVAELCHIHSQLFGLPVPWHVTNAHVENRSSDIQEAFVCGYQAASLVHNRSKGCTGTHVIITLTIKLFVKVDIYLGIERDNNSFLKNANKKGKLLGFVKREQKSIIRKDVTGCGGGCSSTGLPRVIKSH